jgi:predicted transcriptional regulator
MSIDLVHDLSAGGVNSESEFKCLPGTIRDVMSPEVPLIDHDATLPEVVAAFIEYDTRRLIVVDQAGRAVGLISDADAVSRVQPQERRGMLSALRQRGPMPSSDVTAGDLMSRGVLSAGPDTEVVEAARRMLSQGRIWLVVVDEAKKPIGLVDRQILLQAVSGQ